VIIPSFNGYTSVKCKATLDRAFIFAAPILRDNTPTVEILEDLSQLTVLRGELRLDCLKEHLMLKIMSCSTELLRQGCEPNWDQINSNWTYVGLLMQSAFSIPCNSTLRLASVNKHTLIQGWPCFDLQLLVETTWHLRDTNSCLYIAFNTVFYVLGGTCYNCLDGKTQPKRGTFFRFQVLIERERHIKGKGFHKLKHIKGVGKLVI